MIDLAKLAIYRKYGGDADAWTRIATVSEKQVISQQDWQEIDELRQRLTVAKLGSPSTRFDLATEELLQARVGDAAAVELLKEFS